MDELINVIVIAIIVGAGGYGLFSIFNHRPFYGIFNLLIACVLVAFLWDLGGLQTKLPEWAGGVLEGIIDTSKNFGPNK